MQNLCHLVIDRTEFFPTNGLHDTSALKVSNQYRGANRRKGSEKCCSKSRTRTDCEDEQKADHGDGQDNQTEAKKEPNNL